MKTIPLESGHIIYVGQNARENFELIDRSKPDDLWFHLKNLPSCHVILQVQSNADISIVTIEDLKKTAEVCLSNTKYRGLNSVYVEYLPVKYVEKTTTLGKVMLRQKPNFIKLST